MHALIVASVALAIAWALAGAVVLLRRGPVPIGVLCVLLAGAHAGAAAWAALVPVVIAGWVGYALAIPDGRLSAMRRALGAAAAAGAAAWTVVLGAGAHDPPRRATIVVALIACLVGATAAVLRTHGSGEEARRAMNWLAAGSVLSLAAAIVAITLRGMTGEPHALSAVLVGALVMVPIAQVLAALVTSRRAAGAVLVETIVAAGVVALVSVVYIVVVVGIEGTPRGHERSVLLSSLAAALLVAVLAVPARHRLVRIADALVGGREPSRADVVSGFGARMSRAVPMDELMLQLVESLQATMAPAGAEIWTGTDGQLVRTVSVPHRATTRIALGEQERVVVGRARSGGPAWTAVWLPDINAEVDGGDHRVVPIAHLGELLGLLVVRRPAAAEPFDGDDDVALVDLARQLGLALHNVRLDSALQASLAELAERNEELQASRLRIVAAADSSRRAIERNLHDGAQQHLVALAVKLGLTRQVAEEGDTESVLSLLEDLRADVQTTISELRELAHGIYPPLLRDRGLNEALRAAASRMVLPCTVEVELPGRYPEDAETAAYFCCLEAMQNAGKYAGDGASVVVEVTGDAEALRFELRDDGAGFDMAHTELGHGFMNMKDRLGAIGGTLTVESAPGAGTSVRAVIPAHPIVDEVEAGGARAALRSPV